MYTNFNARVRKIFLVFMLVGIILILCSLDVGSPVVHAQDVGMLHSGDDYTASTLTLLDGTLIKKHTINGPIMPPPGFEVERQAVALPKSNGATIEAIGLPGSKWVLGCSAGAAADIAAGYDQPKKYTITPVNANGIVDASSDQPEYFAGVNGMVIVGNGWSGYPNTYTGPTNGGIMPPDNSSWPTWTDRCGETYSNNPLIASHMGVDGRTTRGTIDDYWDCYDSTAADPYITNGWVQHTWGDAIGDYMYTSQSAYGNDDGATAFWVYVNSADPLTCDTMAINALADGTLGRKRFYEARGYAVAECYNQQTDNAVAGGFSFAQFKAEIDAGRPVMLGLAGHTVVGIGYDTASNLVYLRDGWDYDTHSMVWGQGYAGMALQDVSIVNLVPVYIFADVPNTYWANGFIERLYNAGVTGGCGNGNYCPESIVTRAQMAVFLLRGMYGPSYTPPAVGASTGFTDVPVDHWAAAWIKQLAAEGITGGCGSGNYCPDVTVTRAQMAIFLLRAEHGSVYTPPAPTGVFTDVPVGHWADKWIEQLAVEGITGGCGVGVYCPETAVTRAQMAVFLVKTFNLP